MAIRWQRSCGLLKPYEYVVCRHLVPSAVNAAIDTVVVCTRERRVAAPARGVGADSIRDIAGKCYGVMAEEGSAAGLQAVYIETRNAQDADRQ